MHEEQARCATRCSRLSRVAGAVLAVGTGAVILGTSAWAAPATDVADTAVPKAFRAYAQQAAQVRYLDIDSRVLGERRSAAVSLPASYDRLPRQRYPVLVLLDGPEQLAHTESLVRFLARGEQIPEMIIVAVANTQRSRDLTPPLPPGSKGRGPLAGDAPVGGADAFLAFLSDELLPTLDQRYRTAAWRGLLGHSFGGLFGVHALTEKPELFRAYLLASPSLWWGDGVTRARALGAWPRLQRLPGDRLLYLTSGQQEKTIDDSLNAFAADLQRLPGAAPGAPSGLHWARDRLPLDDHGTTAHPTWLNGLRKAFAHWRFALPEQPTTADYAAFLAHRHQRSLRYGLDAAPSLFELTRFALAHAQAGEPRQAVALACELAQHWSEHPLAFGALSRIGGALGGRTAAPNQPGNAAVRTAPAAAPAEARTVYQLALASASSAEAPPATVARVRQQAQGSASGCAPNPGDGA